MRKSEKKKIKILQCLRTIPILTSKQFQKYFFPEYAFPEKRVSALLKSLEKDGFIQGRTRQKKSKIWRLTKKGRDLLQYELPLIPLTSRKSEHIIGLGNIYLDIHEHEKMESFHFEPSYPFVDKEENFGKYCPDALISWNGQLFCIEYQRTAISDKRWAEKWKVGLRYFESSYNTFQPIPKILVVCDQPNHVIQTGSKSLQVYTGKDIMTCLQKAESEATR